MKNSVSKCLMHAAVAVCFTGLASPLVFAAEPAATMNTPAKSALSKGDQAIVIGMAQANINEVEAGKLAVSKSQDATVKAFAQQMIDDHSKALTDVTTLAQNKGVTLPTAPDAKHKAMAAKLSKLDGAKFDKEYMAKAGVDDHKMVHAKLKKDEAAAKDADVKALAAKMLPTVEQHLHHATEAKAGAPAKT